MQFGTNWYIHYSTAAVDFFIQLYTEFVKSIKIVKICTLFI